MFSTFMPGPIFFIHNVAYYCGVCQTSCKNISTLYQNAKCGIKCDDKRKVLALNYFVGC